MSLKRLKKTVPLCDDVGEETDLYKLIVKGTIRRVLGERIVALCKDTGRYLIGKIALRTLLPVALALTTSRTQSGLVSFFEDEEPEPSEETESENKIKSQPDDKDSESVGAGEGDEASVPSDTVRGLIYARVSSGKQLKSEGDDEEVEYDEGSIEGQIDELTDLAKNEGIELPYGPITDEAKTGTDFDRDGIQEVFEIAKRKNIDCLLVEKVDRIGRSAPETLYFIYILQSECDVTLLTPSGEHDIDTVEGLMQTTLLSLMAEVQNEIRTTKAKKERIRGFLHKKNWNCKSPKIPLGYDKTDDGWLEVNSEEQIIVRDLFRKFVECETYAETERYIDKEYGPSILDGHKVKTLLTNWVYIGKPRLPEEWVTETTYENNLEDPSLHLLRENESSPIDVSEETFRETQETISVKDDKHSSDEDSEQLLDFIEEFSLFAVIEGSDPATLLHHCGEPLVTDGQRDLKGRKVHRYRCRECEESEDPESYYRQWPRGYELERIKLIQEVLDGESTLFEDP